MLQVNLPPGLDGPRLACLREPCARDELACADTRPVTASYLLERLLLKSSSATISPDSVWTMTLSDRDRLIAALHQHCFGDSIQAVVTCASCQQRFELGFSLQDLLDEMGRRTREAHRRLCEQGKLEGERALSKVTGDGEVAAQWSALYALGDGLRFRAPATGDERDLSEQVDPRQSWIIERCLVGEAEPGVGHKLEQAQVQALEQALDQLAPILSVELSAECRECHATQTAHFDMAGYFLEALVRERPLVVREIHCLARAYGWNHSEILGLPRSLRQAYVALIVGESEPQELWA